MATARPISVRLDVFRRVVTDAPVSYSIYSAFSFYGARRGGELPGPWLVRALGDLGHASAATRQALYRMEGTAELESRLDGRVKHYRLTPTARAESDAGLAKIMDREDVLWDGRWTIVRIASVEHDRVARERLVDIAHAEGFAPVGGGLFLHPRDRASRLIAAAEQSGSRYLLEVFRGERVGGSSSDLVARYWDLSSLSLQYTRFIRRYGPLVSDRTAHRPLAAFVLRFAVVFDFLETAWRDPDLSPELLPGDWPGERARRVARTLYLRLLPQAIAHADQLMKESP